MTAHAWLVTTWGRIRETLQPELFSLRNELRQAKDDLEGARTMMIGEREMKRQAQRNANELSMKLDQRTRELKAARAKVRQAAKVK